MLMNVHQHLVNIVGHVLMMLTSTHAIVHQVMKEHIVKPVSPRIEHFMAPSLYLFQTKYLYLLRPRTCSLGKKVWNKLVFNLNIKFSKIKIIIIMYSTFCEQAFHLAYSF